MNKRTNYHEISKSNFWKNKTYSTPNLKKKLIKVIPICQECQQELYEPITRLSVGHSLFSALAVFGEWMSKCTRQAKFQLAVIGEWILKCTRQKLFQLAKAIDHHVFQNFNVQFSDCYNRLAFWHKFYLCRKLFGGWCFGMCIWLLLWIRICFDDWTIFFSTYFLKFSKKFLHTNQYLPHLASYSPNSHITGFWRVGECECPTL